MGISLVFSAGKPCCSKKAGKNKVSCKFNQVTVGTEKGISGELTAEGSEGSSKTYKCNTAKVNKCAKSCAKKPWWQFWAKKSTNNCPCKQTDVTNAVLE